MAPVRPLNGTTMLIIRSRFGASHGLTRRLTVMAPIDALAKIERGARDSDAIPERTHERVGIGVRNVRRPRPPITLVDQDAVNKSDIVIGQRAWCGLPAQFVHDLASRSRNRLPADEWRYGNARRACCMERRTNRGYCKNWIDAQIRVGRRNENGSRITIRQDLRDAFRCSSGVRADKANCPNAGYSVSLDEIPLEWKLFFVGFQARADR